MTFTPAWNTNFNSYGFGANTFSPWNTFSSPWASSSSSTKSKEYETYKEYIERLKKERELAEEELKIRDSKEEIKKVYDEQLKAIELQASKIENGKKNDGSSTVTVPNKDLGFWGKAGRWVSNAGTVLKNMGKNLIGYKEDGSWSLGKCLKNVAITAGAVALTFLPVIGPIIGAGMLATGVIGGTIGVAKGVAELDEAKTDAEKDKAQQKILANAFMGITSVFGVKGLGKSFRTSSATASQASAATSRSGFVGKLAENTSNFGRDMTVNFYKATKNAVSKDMKDVYSNGYWNTTKSKMTEILPINQVSQRFKDRYNDVRNSVDTKLTKVNGDIDWLKYLQQRYGSLTPAESQRLALLKEERLLLQKNQTELNSYFATTREKSLYDKLSKDNSGTRAQKRIANRNASATPNRVQDVDIPEEQLTAFYKRISQEQAQYAKSIKKLVADKNNYMNALAAKPDVNAAELNKYIKDLDIKKKWYNPNHWRKTDYQLAINGKSPKDYKALFLSPASNAPKALGAWVDPIYTGPFLFSEELTAEQTEEIMNQLEVQKKALEAELSTLKEIKTEKELEAYKAKLAQAEPQKGETEKASA